jgi:hypothetical protein
MIVTFRGYDFGVWGINLPVSDPSIFGAWDTCSIGVDACVRQQKKMLFYAGGDTRRKKRGMLADDGALLLLPLLSCRRSAGNGGIPETESTPKKI